ncbi:hypothetical protein U9M48_030368 [Paspalum notatum var. saurae]|uniref:Transposase n=1 Tax=Paspalum notatum var. saurae TaxID=547442 RepID=A0AAQ3U0W0_PASNO
MKILMHAQIIASYTGNKKKDDDFCPTCKASRWKDREPESILTKKERRKATPCKVLRYFPIKERLKRQFMCKETAAVLRWHDEERVKDDVLRHPADAPAWKRFDEKFPVFASESRNLHFGLATDGFNPFGMLSSMHSCWPVVLVIYNLPPWLCMKEHSIMLSLMIPGPKSPGDKIHVFLQPLLEDLKDLFQTGMSTYDASRDENFTLRGAVLMTISDLPGLGMLASHMVHGKFACPPCGENVWTKQLKNGLKSCFMGNRQLLSADHHYRFDANSFDGTVEHGTEPTTYYDRPILAEIAALGNFKDSKTYKSVSSLFTLPYWDDNILRYNLDVMHIEKNVFENLYGTIFNVDGKTKDNLQARLDLVDMNIREDLHPQEQPSGKWYLPAARFAMSKNERRAFCDFLRNVKVPDGYCRNISKCVNVVEDGQHNDVPSEFDATSGGEPNKNEEVTRRGKTKLKHVWNMPKGQRIVVKCNEVDQAVGEEAGVLGKFLGMVARNGCLCSLSYKDWRLLIGKKDRVTDELKNKKDILKQVKDMSNANRINCAKKKGPHTTGTISFARKREELGALKELITEHPDLADNSEGKIAWKGDALTRRLGEEKPGHVHGMGLVPNLDKVLECSTSSKLKRLNLTSVDATSSEDVVSLKLQMEKLVNHVQAQDATIQKLQLQKTVPSEQNQRQPEHLDEPLSGTNDVQPTGKRKRVYTGLHSADFSLLEDVNDTRRKAPNVQQRKEIQGKTVSTVQTMDQIEDERSEDQHRRNKINKTRDKINTQISQETPQATRVSRSLKAKAMQSSTDNRIDTSYFAKTAKL